MAEWHGQPHGGAHGRRSAWQRRRQRPPRPVRPPRASRGRGGDGRESRPALVREPLRERDQAGLGGGMTQTSAAAGEAPVHPTRWALRAGIVGSTMLARGCSDRREDEHALASIGSCAPVHHRANATSVLVLGRPPRHGRARERVPRQPRSVQPPRSCSLPAAPPHPPHRPRGAATLPRPAPLTRPPSPRPRNRRRPPRSCRCSSSALRPIRWRGGRRWPGSAGSLRRGWPSAEG